MARLPRIAEIVATSSGTGFFLCARKERRTGRGGPFLAVLLQDISGEIWAKVFQDVDQITQQFEVGEFVAVQGRGNLHHDRLELLLDKIRRVIPEDAKIGFREEDCIPASPRNADEMWQELSGHIASIGDPLVRELVSRLVAANAERLKIWPAARQMHHAYRSGLLEHVLKIIEVARFLADAYGARRDLVVAGAILHDIGKLQELSYSTSVDYTLEGNLVGHIVLGTEMARDTARTIEGFPDDLLWEIEHLILSHHGARDHGSPVVPMTVEAFILSAADDFDARMHQVRRHIADDDSDGPFTSYHRNLERMLLKPRS